MTPFLPVASHPFCVDLVKDSGFLSSPLRLERGGFEATDDPNDGNEAVFGRWV